MEPGQQTQGDRGLKKPNTPEFLVKLFHMLQQEEPSIIQWDSGHIHVNDPARLTRYILNKYFRHNKFSSFQRQLNYFAFHKTKGKGKYAPCTYTNNSLIGASLEEILVVKRKTSTRDDLNIFDSPHFTPPSTCSAPSFETPMNDFLPVLDTVLKKRDRGYDQHERLSQNTLEVLPDLFLPEPREKGELDAHSSKRIKNELTTVQWINPPGGVRCIPESAPFVQYVPTPYATTPLDHSPSVAGPTSNYHNTSVAGQLSMFNLQMMPSFQALSRGVMEFKQQAQVQTQAYADTQRPEEMPRQQQEFDDLFSAQRWNAIASTGDVARAYADATPGADVPKHYFEFSDPSTDTHSSASVFPSQFEPGGDDFGLDAVQPNEVEEEDWVWDVLNEALIDDPQFTLEDGLFF